MTDSRVSRRELARLALTGAAGALFVPSVSSAAGRPISSKAKPPMPISNAPVAAPDKGTPSHTPSEGDLLTQAVPVSCGYALTARQARAVAAALKDYPGGFARARQFEIPDDVEPAFAPYAPPRPAGRKGRGR